MSTHTTDFINYEIKKIDANTPSSWHQEGEFHHSIEQDLAPSQDLKKSIPQHSESPIMDQIMESGNFPIRYFRLILKKIGLKKMLESISDPRSGVTHYSVSSLLINAFLISVAGYRSRHAFHSKNLRSKNEPESILSMNTTKIIGSDRVPSSRTIENMFLKFKGDELNDILFEIFHKLLKTKVFQNQRGSKTADGYFLLAIDGVVSHTYYTHHQHPTAACPYCLKRQRGEKIWYLHMNVVCSLVCPNGIKLPLCVYRVRGNPLWVSLEDEKLKQECERSALKTILKNIREKFPKMKFRLLLDSLYANGPAIDLLEKYNCHAIIVFKKGAIPSLYEDMEGLKQLTPFSERSFIKNRNRVEQRAYLFEDMEHQGHKMQIVDLEEKREVLPSARSAEKRESFSHWVWLIVGRRMERKEIFSGVDEGRLRWDEEDLFNTFKNRGFNLKHDMSRAPYSQTIWLHLFLIAFSIVTLMDLARNGRDESRAISTIGWIASLMANLESYPPNLLWSLVIPKQMRLYPIRGP